MTRKIVLNDEQKEYIRKSLLEKKTCSELRKEFNIGEEAFSRIAHEIMGPNFNFRRKSYLDIHYFQKIDSKEKAYWLGFIAADGTITSNEITIQLQARDKEHLLKFSKAVRGNFTLREIKGTNNFGKEYFHYRVGTRCNEWVNDLSQYGIAPNKSLELDPPDINEEFIPYWIIGLMDGDGSINWNRDKIRISFTGTKEVLSFIKEKLNSNAVIGKEHRCENTYRIFIENHLSEEFLKKYKYKDLKFALERKKEFVKNYFD